MKRVAIALLGYILMVVSPAGATAEATSLQSVSHAVRPESGSPVLIGLDPFLIAPNSLASIGLSAFLATNPDFANYAATNISADGASAAIVVLQTNSSFAVTFTVEGPATLLPYADNYLTKAPSAGSGSLTVSGAGLRHIGGAYYAAVLVQGSLGGYTTPNTISVSAMQDSAVAGLDLSLLPPPLVLAHGLWGDRGSLSNIEGYLDASGPWHNQQQLVAPICYSIYLAFDAKSDPLTNGTNPCEVTSQQALQTEVDALLAELDSEHTVGGRVDVVAHSMGGLAVRNYASQSSYASLRNRMLGQFHTIVTLDTPETGSLLANFLVAHRGDTEKAPLFSTPGLVWAAVCGSSDVEACFYANDYPLSANTLPVDTGGVYSLEPRGRSLTNPDLAGPNIANSTWRAVSATAPGNSALGVALDTLIGALYSEPSTAPTLNSILRKLPNDAIVTVDSQTRGASQSYTFPNLEHTSLVSSILTYLTFETVDDNSVVDDPSAQTYQLTACWLAETGSSSCLPKAAEAAAPETAQAPAGNLKLVDRIRVQAPARAELGTPFEIAIRRVTPDSVSRLMVYQEGEEGRTALEAVPITHAANNTLYVRITPRLLGPVKLGIHADFGDGGISVQTTGVYVAPPKFPPPMSFRANDLPALVLTLNGVTRSAMPHPLAIYAAPVGRVYLNARFVKYRLVPQQGNPVIGVQPNGLIRALAPGEAFVNASFGSSVDRLRVIVRAAQE